MFVLSHPYLSETVVSIDVEKSFLTKSFCFCFHSDVKGEQEQDEDEIFCFSWC